MYTNADAIEKRLTQWIDKNHTPEMVRQAEVVPLRQDMMTLLRYVQENQVVGTKSTGNMPRKAVREVTAQFVNPPVLDERIGDQVYKLRSEEDVWSLYFLHILADVGDMLRAAPGRRWQVTRDAGNFFQRTPLMQLAYLLTIWWYHVNWVVAFPYTGMDAGLPEGFQHNTLRHLLALPVGERVEFEGFADTLIQATGLTWAAQTSMTQDILRDAIQQMVIKILEDFAGVACEYQDQPFGADTLSELIAFEVTPLGHSLLEAVALLVA